jgi:hypothetical protein
LSSTARYFRKNWGAPFIIAFILVLLVVAVEISIGSTGPADNYSTYAFYSLVIGIALQIASYLKYGDKKEDEPGRAASDKPRTPIFSPRTRKLLAILVTVIVVVTVGAVAYDYSSTHGFNSLAVTVNYVNTLKEPAGIVVVAFAVTATGGTPPYAYTDKWPDGLVQNSTTGAFTRTFTNQTIPSSVSIIVMSRDGQEITKDVPVPAPSTSSTSPSSSTSTGTSSSGTGTTTTTTSTASTSRASYSKLNVSVSYATELSEPGGNTTVLLGVSAIGGLLPYNFVATWSDGVVQTNISGSFSRTFTAGQTIPTSASVIIISGDDQNANVTVTFSSNS